MSKVVLYTAVTIDGFIARPDGNLDWLHATPDPETGDYGYEELLANTEVIIMGRKTYDEVIGYGIDWPYKNFRTYVVTQNRNFIPGTPSTHILTDDIKEFVLEQKQRSRKDIWLVGGGQLNTHFINDGLIDRMILTIIPKMLGDGIRLFANKGVESGWKLVSVQSFNTGLVNLTYDFEGS